LNTVAGMTISKDIAKGLLDLVDKAKKKAGPFFDEQAPDVVEQFGSPITGYHYSKVLLICTEPVPPAKKYKG
jgi:hypothetical protein